jgi:hypothetical protein
VASLACSVFSRFAPCSKIYRTRTLPRCCPTAFVFFDVILLKNVGDSPFSVRFCRKFASFFPHAILNFL